MRKSQWQTVKDLINSKPIGDVIRRKEIVYAIYRGPAPPRDRYCTSYGYTLDFYIACLFRIGIIRRHLRGVYKICYHIKPNASSKRVQKCAYTFGWKSWFHDFKEIK